MFLAGKQDVTNGDNLLPNSSTIGAFDYPLVGEAILLSK